MGNMTNTFFDNLDAAATWSAGVAFKRSKALPLDKYSVFETKTLAIEYAEKRGAYAETPVSYPGQIIAVAEGNKMVAYVLVEKADGSNLELQQIGIIPTGDDKTIDVTEDGVISLLAADTEVFKKDAEGNPTEEKEINAGAQLVLQVDGTLKWVKPDTTTVEGLSTAVEDLKGRMTTAEGDIDKLEAAIGAASVPESTEGAGDGKEATGVYVAIEAEAARAKAAEQALDEAIKAIDFMDAEEVAGAIEEGIKDLATKKYVDDELAKKVDVETYNTDKKALEDEDAAIREIAEGVKARVDAFLDGTGTEAALDSLQELITYIDSHDDVDIAGILEDIEGIENKLVGVDGTVADYVTAAINALKIEDYAKAADLTALAGKVTTLEGKVDVDKVSEAIAAAEGRAATDAQSKANKALEDAKADTDTKLANYYKKTETYSQTEVNELIKDFATDKEVEDAVAAEADRADKAEKANAAAIEAITKDATIKTLKGIEEALAGKQAAGDYATKTEAQGYADAKDQAIAAAQAQADKGVADAKTAKDAADEAQADANTNALNIQEIEKEINGYTIGEGEETQVVDGLITKVSNNTTRIATAEGVIATNTENIGKNTAAAASAQAQADEALRVANTKTTMGEVEAKGYAVAETVNGQISGINTAIEGINTEMSKKAVKTEVETALGLKADADKVYTKDEINTTINGINTEIGKKADKSYVDEELAKKATNDALASALAEAKKYADDNDTDTKYGIVYDKDNKKIKLTNNVSETEIDATDFIKDGMIDKVELSEDGLNLIITWNTDAGKTDVTTIPLSGLVDVYTGVDGAAIKVSVSADNKISAELKTTVTEDIAKGVAASTTIANYGDIVSHNASDFATAAQGTKADETAETIANYGDIVTHKVDEFATAAQGAKADTAIQSVTSLHDAIVVTPGENGAITINFADEIILNGGGANIADAE